ncbi:16S rRNA (cytosine(967)-C(5))-methyltransferase RsmB [Bacillus sp. S3]|uniref:16S rRNA (cytosine(967)-C(5))-methyltransferase RsmB n=1 Tax=Bacillus sp. S3 TaxID=486398 RepID=UPI00118CEB7E|nr:16S rRNA (cytosine(967)-C(5))-methyltransferase RsmB [Bacillus sp. S3]QCJ42011.1 16S rRNA (cytosine(967)-C(5))-methyltransferase RsmB [Bacillus sp. S3]
MTSTKKNVRAIAMDLLVQIEKNQSYSNLLLNNVIEKNELSPIDVGLLTELTYGTLQRRMALDFYLKPFLKDNKKLANWIHHLLRLTLYQMVYLDRIPDRAAIYEAVEIAKIRGHKGIASLVNGVLRSIQREGLPSMSEVSDPNERLSLETSHPLWLVTRWVNQFGFEKTKEMCEVNLTAPMQTARVNLTKISRDECVAILEEDGYQIEKSPIIPEAIRSLKGNLASTIAFKYGMFTIQDESSMLAAYALGATEGEFVLDACAAPGGKSTHIAEKMQNTGEVISVDLHQHKVKLINDNARRLGLSNIKTNVSDSRRIQEKFKDESFNRILLDAPCSGLGVMRRKPDMKYTKTEQDVERLSVIQQDLLNSVAPLLKKDGILVYSTCTVDKQENEQTVKKFLENHPEFEGDVSFKQRMPESIQPLVTGYDLQIFPQDLGSDGFYIAAIRKKV